MHFCKLIWTTSFEQYPKNQQKRYIFFGSSVWFLFFITSAALCAYFPGGKTSHQRRTLKTIKKNYWGQQNVNSNQTHWCMNLISDLCNLFNYRSTELMSALVDKFWGIFQLRHFVSLRFGIGVFDQERDCSLRCQQYGDTISFWSDLHNMQAPSLCHLSLQWIQD